ncbi:class I SAM-dependent methyltransferase [Actinacidiphila sp. ITFR-21]|uniref:class I SAM-dependent methyltransferase n=1 Tax=Actinacidiphila sp. ITFR-21 TaxID=3075199 RepID=UPI0028891DDD|nr:methyltransferase domain-containing protein [Streptomyces sp. ITFR-21]WNI18833.1 methyltransferase domain-containing protein [Streptomyces sp. ITFR-21]
MTGKTSPTDGTPALDALQVRNHPLCGPADRMPTRYRGPHRLSHDGWLNFTGRLERREEIALVRGATAANRRVLDVGGGTGELTRAVAAEVGHCTTIEPHGSRVATLATGAETGGTGSIDVIPGHAESLPFPDASFDAVFAAWVLPYVDDLEASVRELARVCDAASPRARILLIGGGPGNELVSLLNRACVPVAGEPEDHQGYLLSAAATTLSENGFGRFSLYRTEAALHFPEVSPDARINAAATMMADFWYADHPRVAEMRDALRPELRRHFAHRPHAVGDQGTVLVARPGTAS